MFEIVKYEWLNILRSRWLFAYAALLTLANFGLSYLAADIRRTELVLLSALILFVPLVSIAFTTTYWYSSERFTELLMAQPISRVSLLIARTFSLAVSLTACLAVGLLIPCAVMFGLESGMWWLFLGVAAAGIVFCCLGTLISVSISDRLWGVGLGLAVWFYFVGLHDGLLLLVLYWFRDYPLDAVGVTACALNPLAAVRVALLLHFDAPLLLGHAGAIVRRITENSQFLMAASAVEIFWGVVPLLIAKRVFKGRDF